MEQYEQALQDGLSEVNGKLEDINTALSQVDNLDIDASKSGTISTVTITKKNGTTKSVQILDGDKGETGIGLQYNWNNTSLGVKREDEVNYQYTNLKGDTGNSGVAMSTTQPSDPTVYVWIDTSDDEVISNAESEEF